MWPTDWKYQLIFPSVVDCYSAEYSTTYFKQSPEEAESDSKVKLRWSLNTGVFYSEIIGFICTCNCYTIAAKYTFVALQRCPLY